MLITATNMINMAIIGSMSLNLKLFLNTSAPPSHYFLSMFCDININAEFFNIINTFLLFFIIIRGIFFCAGVIYLCGETASEFFKEVRE